MRSSGASRALRPLSTPLLRKHGIAIDEKHWRRSEAATDLHKRGAFCLRTSLPCIGSLHRLLNEERKGMFYEGEDPDL